MARYNGDMTETRSAELRIRIKPSTMMAIEKAAEAEQRDRSDFVRLLLSEGLQRRGKANG